MTTRWSLGTLIGAPLLALLILALAVLGWYLIHRSGNVKDDFDRAPLLVAGIASSGLAFVALVLTAVGFYPYRADYHQWRPVSGTVAAVSSRILSGDDSGGVNQRFVVQLAGTGKQYGCDDTRCSLIKAGDRITLSCKHEFQYSGVSGYGCSYVDDEGQR